MDEYERYVLDTQGCLLLEDVLSQEEVDLIIKGFPRDAEGEVITEPDNGLLNYEEPLFRQLINHPRILPYLEALLVDCHTEEPWSRLLFLDHEYFIYMRPGESATGFHNGATPFNPWLSYAVRGDKIYCGLVAVIWMLSDAREGDGGFWYIPGSHKANFPMPPGMEEYKWVPDCAVQPAVRAGSAIIFTEALVHGTRQWQAQHDRYVLFYKYLPGHMAFGVNQLEKRTQLLTDEQKPYVQLPMPAE